MTRMRPFRPTAVIAIAIAIAGFILVLSQTLQTNEGSAAQANSLPIPPPAEQVPLYSGSEVISIEGFTDVMPCVRRATYLVPANPPKVSAFYLLTLPKQGWRVTSPVVGRGSTYEWSDDTGLASWDLHLDLWLSEQVYSDAASPRATKLEMILIRIPKISKVPVYPGAKVIAEGNEQISPRKNVSFPVHVTTLTTHDDPDSVSTYYKTVLPHFGWVAVQSNGAIPNIREGIAYKFEIGSVENMRVSSLKIRATEDVDGYTHVKLNTTSTFQEP